MITTKELKTLTDDELLDLVAKAKDHTKDFKEFVGTDFSYKTLCDEISRRGGKNGWYFEAKAKEDAVEEIACRKNGNTVRKAYMVSQSVADEWANFLQEFPVKSVALDAALSRFMEDVRSGRVVFSVYLN